MKMRGEKGFTLIELVVGIVAGAIVAAVAYTLIEPTQSWLFSEARRGGMGGGGAAMMRMVREIRRIKSPGSIATHSPTQLSFVDYDDSMVNFQLVGTNLMRGSNVLIRGVQSLNFDYLNENGISTSVTADIRIVTIDMTIASGAQLVRLSSAERIRNIPY